jgi:hypothetical protein
VKQGFMGAIRILTIAVCNLNLISVNPVPRPVLKTLLIKRW